MRVWIVLAVVVAVGSWATWSEYLRFRRNPLDKPLSGTWEPSDWQPRTVVRRKRS